MQGEPVSAEGRLPRPVPKRYDGLYTRARCAQPPPARLLEAIGQFNAGEYWAQHETLEMLWRLEADDIRYLYQGILLVGVGLHHLVRGNHHGATRKLAHGLRLLRPFAPACQRVDVARLLREGERCLRRVEELGPGGLAAFNRVLLPWIQLLPEDDAPENGGG